MLIYNYKKEFLGIDESDLKNLGFKDLEELRREVSDFADLFVKTPGYIHNFKHVHWIDFIACADSSEESKVIINVNNKNYRAIITIDRAFLVDSPSSRAYIIHLNQLRELSNSDTKNISADITAKVLPSNETFTVDTFDSLEPASQHTSPPPVEQSHILIPDPYEAPLNIEVEEEPLDFQESIEVVPEIIEQSLEMEDLVLDIEEDLSIQESPTPLREETFNNGYVFDPSIASDELGLPLELIEEFIGDFIGQAKEFKNGLYTSFNENNYDDLRILSHKLKGVAANLRIEDALETLTIINSSNDASIIEKNLIDFYKIIAKLAGETITVSPPIAEVQKPVIVTNPVETEDEDEFTIDFKDDDLYSDPIEIIEPQLNITIQEDQSNMEVSAEGNYSKVSAANEIGLDQDTFNELFDDFIHESKTIIENIQEATKNGDYITSSYQAMMLRGMADNMRITPLNEALKTIINSSDNDVIQEAIHMINTMINTISQEKV